MVTYNLTKEPLTAIDLKASLEVQVREKLELKLISSFQIIKSNRRDKQVELEWAYNQSVSNGTAKN